MVDHMQEIVSVLSPFSQEESTTFVSPMPRHVVFGHVTRTNDHEEFLQAFDAGIESYCEIDYEQEQMTTQELLNSLLETIQSDDTHLVWRLGFIAGSIAGLLNPDLAETRPCQPYLEVLSRKCKVLYSGPEHLSAYICAVHQAACIETMPITELPSSLPTR